MNPLLSHRMHGSPKNPAVLMLHGFLGCKEDWEEAAKALSDDYYVVTMDLPGHGKSVAEIADEFYSMSGSARAVVELLDQAGMDRCSIIGYSMGGRLALYLAARYPDRVSSAVIESASPGLRTDEERRSRRSSDHALAEKLLSRDLDEFLSDWYAQPLFEPLKRCSHFKEVMKRRLAGNPQGLARSLRMMGTGVQPSLWEELARIRIPMLFLAGGLDAKFRDLAEEMAHRCPAGRALIVDGVGHTVHVEASEPFPGIVRRFLEERK